MTLGWVEKQCVFCGKGKGETVRCPNDVDMLVMDFMPCLACEALHEGQVVVSEAISQEELTGRHRVLTREEAARMLIESEHQYCLLDVASYSVLFAGDDGE